jgi:3-hydroxybutyryl-CoA dehydrogenase
MTTSLERIGILGAGVMGSGIAQVMAIAGHEVTCYDIAEEALGKGRETIDTGRFGVRTAVARGKLDQDTADAVLELVTFTTKWDDIAACDVVIEAVPENLELKMETFKKLEATCSAEAILASNSSGFSITALAGATSTPERVIGWHWASPVPVMKLAEITRGPATSDATVETIVRLAAAAGKNPIVIKDQPRTWGYVANRVYAGMRREAQRVVDEGIATAEEVDALLMDCFRWPTGPFSMGRGAGSGWK